MSECGVTCSKESLEGFLRELLADCQPNAKRSSNFLDTAINMAVSKVANTNKQEFAKTKTVTLKNGECIQSVCDDCEGVIEVVTGADGDCDPPKTERNETDTWLAKQYGGVCAADSDSPYVIESVDILADSGCEFRVNPAVPDDGKVHTVKILCTDIPCLDGGDVPASLCRHWSEIVYLAAGVLLMMEDDAETAGKAQIWFNLYFKMVELERAADQDTFIKSISYGTRVDPDSE